MNNVVDIGQFKVAMLNRAQKAERESYHALVAAQARLQDEWDALVASGAPITEEFAQLYADAMRRAADTLLTADDINWDRGDQRQAGRRNGKEAQVSFISLRRPAQSDSPDAGEEPARSTHSLDCEIVYVFEPEAAMKKPKSGGKKRPGC